MRKGKKKNVVIYLDPEIVKEARDLGLNISKISENALKEAIRRLKGENLQNSYNSGNRADPPGFEPGIYGLEGRRSIHAEPRARLVDLTLKEFKFFSSLLLNLPGDQKII